MPKASDFLVLVVDDEEDIRMYLSAALEDAGFRVVTASDGKAALEAVRRDRPALVSLDLVMPGKTGIAFLHEMRRHREWVNIPVIIVTGHARDELGKADLAKALDDKLLSGPQTYLEKPVTAATYVSAISQTLGVAPAPGAGANEEDALRSQAGELLKGASPDQLRALIGLLKRS
jgi:CheY-like chemotaxis protein